MAVDRVEQRLRKVTAALDAAGVSYAVVGGNAVAAWVAKADPSATRTTKDVDLLVRRGDVEAVTRAIEGIGFQRLDMRDLVMFIDPNEPSKRSGVHLVWAGERVRPSYTAPSPRVEEAVRGSEGFAVLSLGALVRMKLTSFRDIDRVHVGDLIDVGLIDDTLRAQLPSELQARLDEVRRGRESNG